MTPDEATVLRLLETSAPDALLAAVAAEVFELPAYDVAPERPSPLAVAVKCLFCGQAVWREPQGGLRGAGRIYCSVPCRRRAKNQRHAAKTPRAAGRFARLAADPAPRRDAAPAWVKLDGAPRVLA